MASRIRNHIRSNVVGYVALFFALSLGTAYATHPGGANTISSGDIINSEVKSADLGNGEVKNDDLAPNAVGSGKIADGSVKNADLSTGASSSNTIADGGIQGIDVKNNTLTGTQVDESTLSGVPSTPTGPAGGDLAGTYPNPTIKTPLNLTGNSGGSPTVTASNAATFGVGLLGSGYWGLFGSTDSGESGATGVSALGDGPGAHGLTALAAGNGGTGVDVQANGTNGVALEARATGAATKAADIDGTVEIDGSTSTALAPLLDADNGGEFGVGLKGTSFEGFGVHGVGTGFSGTGVVGQAGGGGGVGVFADGSGTGFDGAALRAEAFTSALGNSGTAGEFDGRVEVDGKHSVNVLSVRNEGIGSALTANSVPETGGTGVRTQGDIGVDVNGGLLGVIASADSANGTALEANALGAATQAGAFDGDVDIQGTLTKSSGSFRIDHPLDPGGKYLSHSFVESPEMKNVYDGVVTTDGHGFAVVRLPAWFDALNRGFRYQLTVLGRSFARAIVWRQLRANRFRIRTNRPDVKVSWQVTGIRDDAYADANPIDVVEPKRGAERGRYLHPELFGQPAGKRIGATASSRGG